MVKHTQTMRRQQSTNCLSVFDHFVGLALIGLSTAPLSLEIKYMPVAFFRGNTVCILIFQHRFNYQLSNKKREIFMHKFPISFFRSQRRYRFGDSKRNVFNHTP